MTSAAASSKSFAYRIVLPAAIVLSSLSLFYSIRGGEKLGESQQLLANPSESVAVSQRAISEPKSEVHPQTEASATDVRARRSFAPTASENSQVLAQMHKNIASMRGQHGDPIAQIAELDRVHKAESVDAKWAAQSEADILSASIQPVMIDSGLAPQGVAADCRSSTCRISAHFSDVSDANSWANMLVTQMGATLSQVKMAITRQPDGSSEVRIYGARLQPSRS